MAHKEAHESLTVWVPRGQARKLKKLAKTAKRSVSAEINVAIDAHVDKSAPTV